MLFFLYYKVEKCECISLCKLPYVETEVSTVRNASFYVEILKFPYADTLVSQYGH